MNDEQRAMQEKGGFRRYMANCKWCMALKPLFDGLTFVGIFIGAMWLVSEVAKI